MDTTTAHLVATLLSSSVWRTTYRCGAHRAHHTVTGPGRPGEAVVAGLAEHRADVLRVDRVDDDPAVEQVTTRTC